jgi:hypothetical protein
MIPSKNNFIISLPEPDGLPSVVVAHAFLLKSVAQAAVRLSESPTTSLNMGIHGGLFHSLKTKADPRALHGGAA